jgi:predicted nucleic acid-binding protein
MVCLDTSFLIDVLDAEQDAKAVMVDLDERGVRPTVTPVSAAELWVGANLGSVHEYEATAELLDSLTWLPFTRTAARRAGKLQADLSREGEPLAFTDCMIAAIALENDEKIVTGDDDFERIAELELQTY